MKKAAQWAAFVCSMQTPERFLFHFYHNRIMYKVKFLFFVIEANIVLMSKCVRVFFAYSDVNTALPLRKSRRSKRNRPERAQSAGTRSRRGAERPNAGARSGMCWRSSIRSMPVTPRARQFEAALPTTQKDRAKGGLALGAEVFSAHRRPCMKPSIAVAWMSPPMTRLR